MSSTRLNQLLAFQESNPKDSFVLFALAKEYEKLDEDDKALNHYLKIVSHDPGYVGVYYHLGKLHEKLGNTSAAFEAYRRGMEIARQSGDQHAFNELAAAKLNLGDSEDFIS
jgi:tetratricopeptide (TPR) repeat protein